MRRRRRRIEKDRDEGGKRERQWRENRRFFNNNNKKLLTLLQEALKLQPPDRVLRERLDLRRVGRAVGNRPAPAEVGHRERLGRVLRREPRAGRARERRERAGDRGLRVERRGLGRIEAVAELISMRDSWSWWWLVECEKMWSEGERETWKKEVFEKVRKKEGKEKQKKKGHRRTKEQQQKLTTVLFIVSTLSGWSASAAEALARATRLATALLVAFCDACTELAAEETEPTAPATAPSTDRRRPSAALLLALSGLVTRASFVPAAAEDSAVAEALSTERAASSGLVTSASLRLAAATADEGIATSGALSCGGKVVFAAVTETASAWKGLWSESRKQRSKVRKRESRRERESKDCRPCFSGFFAGAAVADSLRFVVATF